MFVVLRLVLVLLGGSRLRELSTKGFTFPPGRSRWRVNLRPVLLLGVHFVLLTFSSTSTALRQVDVVGVVRSVRPS